MNRALLSFTIVALILTVAVTAGNNVTNIKTIWSNQILALNERPVSYYDSESSLYYMVSDYQIVAMDANTGTTRKEFKIPNQSCLTRSVQFVNSKSMWYSHIYNVLPTFTIHQVDLESGVFTDYPLNFASQGYIAKYMKSSNMLISVVSPLSSPGHHCVIAAISVDNNSLGALKWNYSATCDVNLNAIAIDDTNSLVYAIGSNSIAKINAVNGQVISTVKSLPDYFLMMQSTAQVSPDSSIIYIAALNNLRSEYGAGLAAVDPTSGDLIKWYSLPGKYASQVVRSIDGNHLYVNTDTAISMFCMKGKKVVWSIAYTDNNRFTISAIGSSESPILAYSSSTADLTMFVDPEKHGEIIGSFNEYLGDQMIPASKTEFFSWVQGKTPQAKCTKRMFA